MSRFVKQKLKEHLRAIKNSQLKRAYAKCQDNVEAFISYMYSLNEEGSEIVELLEMHYRLLFQISTGEISLSPLTENLSKITAFIESELQSKKIEVVFLSQLASMSDSVESIYLAAKADPDCDAYWIPIPYFDIKNKQLQIDNMHFEGEGYYCDEIVLTDWRKYNIEARHPDIIFTYNANDSYSKVSIVHPDFFSQRLCKLTDLLVYIPYYVETDRGVSDSHCVSQSCIYAHKVVLSTEKLRERYTRLFEQAYGNKYGNPNDKFVALGSPKYDKVITTRRESCLLPEAWQDLIKNKKVITYISSIIPFLETTDTYLNKLELMLETFKSQNDVLLWWRPHPVLATTINSMREDQMQRYNEIVEAFKKEEWGIFDETGDLHSAIAWSDGFYGDYSSILLMFQVVGKPVMLADTTISIDELKPFLGSCRYDRDADDLTAFINDIVEEKYVNKKIYNDAIKILNADGTAGEVIFEFAKDAIKASI